MKKRTKAELVLGRVLMRQVQRRFPEGGRLTIPPLYPARRQTAPNPHPPKTGRNRDICEAVAAGEPKGQVAARFGISAGRVTAILKDAARWTGEES